MRAARLARRPKGTIVLLGKETGTEVTDVPSKNGLSAILESRDPTRGEDRDASREGSMLSGGMAFRSLATDGRSMGLRFWTRELVSMGLVRARSSPGGTPLVPSSSISLCKTPCCVPAAPAV